MQRFQTYMAGLRVEHPGQSFSCRYRLLSILHQRLPLFSAPSTRRGRQQCLLLLLGSSRFHRIAVLHKQNSLSLRRSDFLHMVAVDHNSNGKFLLKECHRGCWFLVDGKSRRIRMLLQRSSWFLYSVHSNYQLQLGWRVSIGLNLERITGFGRSIDRLVVDQWLSLFG